jgi:hypothetical protein
MLIRSRRRSLAQPVALCLKGTNRYERWAYATDAVDGPFAGPPLSDQDVSLALAWAVSQRVWNMHLAVLRGADGDARVLAIAGAEDIHPEWIVYPCDGGYQSDESSESTWSPTLDDALCQIANMPAGSSLSLLAADPGNRYECRERSEGFSARKVVAARN